MTKIVCILCISTNIINTQLFKQGFLVNQEERITQYIKGINKFIELNKKFIDEKIIDVYLADNTIENKSKMPLELLNIIPDNIKIITSLNNNYGCYNKGAGVIEQWIYYDNLIKEYDYLIHFEPRQLLINNNFINNFINNPRNLFTYNCNKQVREHFNTGLFTCKSNELIHFIEENKPEYLVKENLSIEYVLYDFFKKYNFTYDTLDKMNLIWYAGDGIDRYW
tara:strand:- start:199 stop:867 length:669 start_codon:yes stop_codon:yes gene_type:complete